MGRVDPVHTPGSALDVDDAVLLDLVGIVAAVVHLEDGRVRRKAGDAPLPLLSHMFPDGDLVVFMEVLERLGQAVLQLVHGEEVHALLAASAEDGLAHVLRLSLLLIELLLEAADEDPRVYDGVGELLLGPLQQPFPDLFKLPVPHVGIVAQMMASYKGSTTGIWSKCLFQDIVSSLIRQTCPMA